MSRKKKSDVVCGKISDRPYKFFCGKCNRWHYWDSKSYNKCLKKKQIGESK